jgi:hypothetical protein
MKNKFSFNKNPEFAVNVFEKVKMRMSYQRGKLNKKNEFFVEEVELHGTV